MKLNTTEHISRVSVSTIHLLCMHMTGYSSIVCHSE